MKKVLLALTALAAFTGSASAADLAARPYTKAPAPALAPSWTGFYVFGGGGGGIWNADTRVVSTATGASILGINQSQGGDGFLGTVGAGYDWQFTPSWVFGVFADGQWGSLKGTIQDQGPFAAGRINNDYSYAAGARVGYLVAPNVLSYVNGGYSGSHWNGTTLLDTRTGGVIGSTNGFDRSGWFVGGGVEHTLGLFGINAPGWFVKTEYRSAFYDTKNISELNLAGVQNGRDITFKPWVQTITTSVVYRFNWGGAPIAAKY
jgi:outer membrane immunogenic protein